MSNAIRQAYGSRPQQAETDIANGLILGVDPGNTHTAYAAYDPICHRVDFAGYAENIDVLFGVPDLPVRHIAIEMVACYGMPVGREVFETCVWIGRFRERWGMGEFIYRRDVKLELCNSARAKDGNVRQAIIDRFEPTGGGKTPQVGTKNCKGPLYGVSGDMWAALGVALTFDAVTNPRR